jgi:hypothetical protein
VGAVTSADERADRPLRLRIHISGSYAAQAIGTHAHIRAIVRDADRLFASTIGAHLVIEEIVDGWKVDVGRSGDALRALMDEVTADGIDVVVGMLGGASKREDGCLGQASLGSKYMVVRTEDGDSESEHKMAVVAFLHELGHALGARHDEEPGSIMNEAASPSAISFGHAAGQVIRSGLARDGIEVATWPSSGAGRSSAASSTVSNARVTSADRPTLDQALDAERRGDVQEAWRTAERLFVAYPEVIEVQDLRCRLANGRQRPWSEVRAECSMYMRLMMLGANPLE